MRPTLPASSLRIDCPRSRTGELRKALRLLVITPHSLITFSAAPLTSKATRSWSWMGAGWSSREVMTNL